MAEPGTHPTGPGWVGETPWWATPTLALHLDDALLRTQVKGRAPSVTAGVSLAGRPVWARSVGLAEVGLAGEGPDRPAGPADQYRIGSITKTFTAAAVLQLRDEGALDLSDRLGDHVSGASGPVADARLSQLLGHLSGLQREPPGELWNTQRAPEVDELLALAERAEGVAPPGAHWHYSNLAYGLLGQVVANLRATSYEKAVSERLLSPLGLDRTSWAPEPPAASGYDVHPHGDHVAQSPAMELRSLASLGQLWSTVGDLGRWGCFLSDPDLVPGVLATDTVAGMHSPLTVTDLSGWSEAGGTGVSLYRHRDQVYGGHGGSMPGFLAKLVYTRPSGTGPAGGVAVGVVSNADGGPDLHSLALDLCSTVAGAAHRPEPWAPGPPPPAEVEAVLGAWWSGAEQMVLRHRSGRLEAVDPDDPAAPVVELVGDGPGCYRAVSGGQRGERLVVEVDGAALPVRLLFATYAYQRSPGRTPLREKG